MNVFKIFNPCTLNFCGFQQMDYEVDSDDEWEEEEPGESLSDDEKEVESEDEYEIDNGKHQNNSHCFQNTKP